MSLIIFLFSRCSWSSFPVGWTGRDNRNIQGQPFSCPQSEFRIDENPFGKWPFPFRSWTFSGLRYYQMEKQFLKKKSNWHWTHVEKAFFAACSPASVGSCRTRQPSFRKSSATSTAERGHYHCRHLWTRRTANQWDMVDAFLFLFIEAWHHRCVLVLPIQSTQFPWSK